MESSITNQGTVNLKIPLVHISAQKKSVSPKSKLLKAETHSKLKSPKKCFSKCCICDAPIPKSPNIKVGHDVENKSEEWRTEVFRTLCTHLNVAELLDPSFIDGGDGIGMADAFPLCVVCTETASKMSSLSKQIEILLGEIESLAESFREAIITSTLAGDYDQVLEKSDVDNLKAIDRVRLFRNLVLQKGTDAPMVEVLENDDHMMQSDADILDFARIETVSSVCHSENDKVESHEDKGAMNVLMNEDVCIKDEELSPCVSPSPAFSPISFHEADYVWPPLPSINNRIEDVPEKITLSKSRKLPVKRKLNYLKNVSDKIVRDKRTKVLKSTVSKSSDSKSSVSKSSDSKSSVSKSSDSKSFVSKSPDSKSSVSKSSVSKSSIDVKKLPKVDREGYSSMLKLGIPFKRVEVSVNRIPSTYTEKQIHPHKLRQKRQHKATLKFKDWLNIQKENDDDDIDSDEFNSENSNPVDVDPDYCPKGKVTEDEINVNNKSSQKSARTRVSVSSDSKLQIVSDGLSTRKSKLISSVPIKKEYIKPVAYSKYKGRTIKRKTEDGKISVGNTEILVNSSGTYTCGTCGQFRQSERLLVLHINETHAFTVDEDSQQNPNHNSPTAKQKHNLIQRTTFKKDGRRFYRSFEILKTAEGQHKCVKCNKIYKSMGGVREHIRFVHLNQTKPKKPQKAVLLRKSPYKIINTASGKKAFGQIEFEKLDNGVFRCSSQLCKQRIYKSQAAILHHINGVHLKRLTRRSVVSKKEKAIIKTIKTLDGRRFYRGTELLRTPAGKQKCGTCNKELATRASLTAHIARCHENSSGSSSCKYCGKTVSHKFLLDSYKRKHETSKEYVCEKCEKSNKHTQSLYNHRRQYHDKYSRQECEICGKKFASVNLMREHEKKTHGKTTKQDEVPVTMPLKQKHKRSFDEILSSNYSASECHKELPLLSRQDQENEISEDVWLAQKHENFNDNGPPKLLPFYINTSSENIISDTILKDLVESSGIASDTTSDDNHFINNTTENILSNDQVELTQLLNLHL